jgi:hypothetical protein
MESIPGKAIRITFLRSSLPGIAVQRTASLRLIYATAIHLFRKMFFFGGCPNQSGHEVGGQAASPEMQSCGYSFPSSRSLSNISSYFLL